MKKKKNVGFVMANGDSDDESSTDPSIDPNQNEIELVDTASKKFVKRLNLMFDHETPENMETRRLTAHFFRMMHLLQLSIT